jgi:hypothetical protein
MIHKIKRTQKNTTAQQVKASTGNKPKFLASIPSKKDESPEDFAKRFLKHLSDQL